MQLSHRQVRALRRALQEPNDVVFRRGRVDVSARAMAADALQRASRDSASAALARTVNLGYAKVKSSHHHGSLFVFCLICICCSMSNLWQAYPWHGPARMVKTILLQVPLGLRLVLVYFVWCLRTCCTKASKLDIQCSDRRQQGSRQRNNSTWSVTFFRCYCVKTFKLSIPI